MKRLVWVVLGWSLLANVHRAEERGLLSTLAGTGQPGYAGDGGPAAQARLKEPFHLTQDRHGNVYIAESGNHCIRKIDGRTQAITTIAGTGQPGYTGDGGPARQATFREPYAVVVDDHDHLFIVDRLNAAIRRIDARTGIITTIAGTGQRGSSGDGGPATQARLVEPNDCYLDGKGGLLIADVSDWRIRRVDLGTGIITTFAGVGVIRERAKRAPAEQDGMLAREACLPGARAVCTDSQGRVYICLREGNAVRRVDHQGRITTVAGTGVQGYSGDGGPARQATLNGPKGIRCDGFGNLLIVDAENNAIRRVNPETGVISTVAGGHRGSDGDEGPASHAGLAQPHGCITDFSGSLLIADTLNHRIRRVAPPANLPLVFREDFEHGAGHWRPTDANAWRIEDTPQGKVYSLYKQSQFQPPYRSPFNFSLRQEIYVGDFALEGRVQSTVKDYPHRDMCMIFGYQDPSHFYYVHFGKRTDDHANQIFIVNGAPRVKISTRTTAGTNWDDAWHQVKMVRRLAEGSILVYFDDMQAPVMEATDRTFLWGQVGIGSFDDLGRWDDVILHGIRVNPPPAAKP